MALPSAAPGASAGQELEDFFRQATTILREASSARHAEDEIRRLARPLFDVPGAAQRILERQWGTLSARQRQEFIRLFGDRFLRAYFGIVRGLLPRDRPPIVRLVGEDVDAGGRISLVRTVVRAKDGADVRFDYVMTRAKSSWLVHDVVVDGVSLVQNYRAQVVQVLHASSYAGLMTRLRGDAVEAEGQAPVPPAPFPRRAAETP